MNWCESIQENIGEGRPEATLNQANRDEKRVLCNLPLTRGGEYRIDDEDGTEKRERT